MNNVFRACDDKYLEDQVDKMSPGVVPIWLTKDWDIVTKKVLLQEKSNGFSYLFAGSETSDCALPCTTFNTETRFLSEYASTSNAVFIMFSPTVEVTTTNFVIPTLSSFLSEVRFSFI